MAAVSLSSHSKTANHAYSGSGENRISPAGLGGVFAAHAALALLLVHLDALPTPSLPQTLSVSLLPIAAEAPAPQPEPSVTPRPPVPRAKPLNAPVLAAAADASHSASVPEAREAPPPAPASATNAPSVPANTAVSLPRFDADYLRNPAPVYPAMSRRMGEEGRVMLRVFVDAGGRPTQIEVNSSSGSPRLDAAAQEAVWRWSFVAARRGDETVGAWVLVPIVFNLRG